MLTRIITAAVLIPLVVSAVLYLSPAYFAVGLGAVVVLSLYEWFNLFVRSAKRKSISFLVGLSFYLIGGIGLMLLASPTELYHYQPESILFPFFTAFWICLLVDVVKRPSKILPNTNYCESFFR